MLYRRIIINPTDGFFKEYTREPSSNPLWVHLVLFAATLVTTTAVGAFMAGKNPFDDINFFINGFPFSLTLLTILGVHEFGHYFAARSWGIHVTLPYFIPAPFLPIGTFGAVIKMKSSIPSRKALIDVGAAGPIAGFIVSLAACIIGLKLSTILPIQKVHDDIMPVLGESLIFKFIGYMTIGYLPDEMVIVLHPVAFAGWLGLFVTALNLIPFGQLDGGHILFALSPRFHELARRIRTPLLLLMGVIFWSGWYVWALILLIIGRSHPYPDYMEYNIGKWRTSIAVAAMVIFVLCIMPAPIKVR